MNRASLLLSGLVPFTQTNSFPFGPGVGSTMDPHLPFDGHPASVPLEASGAAPAPVSAGHEKKETELARSPSGMWCRRVRPDYFYL